MTARAKREITATEAWGVLTERALSNVEAATLAWKDATAKHKRAAAAAKRAQSVEQKAWDEQSAAWAALCAAQDEYIAAFMREFGGGTPAVAS